MGLLDMQPGYEVGPSGEDREDDFCDMLARMGQGMQLQIAGDKHVEKSNVVTIVPGTGGWMYQLYHPNKKEQRKKHALGGN